jgi:hypothetical protein
MFIFHLDSSIVGKRSHNRRIFIYLMSAIFNGGNVSNTTIESNFKNISNSMMSFIRQNGASINSQFPAGRVL